MMPVSDWYGSKREEPAPGQFFVRMGDDCGYMCDPASPLRYGCLVAYVAPDGRYFVGTLQTKHPERAKTLSIRIRGLPSGPIPRKDAARCVQMVRDI